MSSNESNSYEGSSWQVEHSDEEKDDNEDEHVQDADFVQSEDDIDVGNEVEDHLEGLANWKNKLPTTSDKEEDVDIEDLDDDDDISESNEDDGKESVEITRDKYHVKKVLPTLPSFNEETDTKNPKLRLDLKFTSANAFKKCYSKPCYQCWKWLFFFQEKWS